MQRVWLPQLRQHCGEEAFFVVAGNKVDMPGREVGCEVRSCGRCCFAVFMVMAVVVVAVVVVVVVVVVVFVSNRIMRKREC